MANRIDSNVTGLRYAEETSLRVVDPAAVWHPLEPNSYNDFGGQLQTMVRTPISENRQRAKGTITDMDASGGFNQDFTQSNLTRLLQGFFFADIREKKTTQPMNGAAIVMTAVDGNAETYSAAAGLGTFLINHLVLASGFGVATNNGLKKLTAVAAGLLTTTGLDAEANPPAEAKLEAVGYEFAAASLDLAMVGGFPRLSRVAGVFDLTTLGLIPGEWIFLGGDAAGNTFANNQGFARVKSVTASYIDLDKTSWTPQAEVGGGKSIRIFFGNVLKNEATSNLIKKRTYQVERTLGSDTDGQMSEYLIGAVPNEFTLNVAQADKVTADVSFVAMDLEQRTGATGVKTGTRPALPGEDAFNTTSDMSRIKLALIDPASASPLPLFAFATEVKLGIKNNVSAAKAIGYLGGFDTTAGMFEVSGNLTAYFASVAAVQAVRNNSDVTLDVAIAKHNKGLVFDVPLLSLGDGRLKVEKDQAITLPLEVNAAAHPVLNHTLLLNVFPYLPTAAE